VKRRAESDASVLELLESSVHLLRGSSPATFLWYYAGSVPFVLAFLFAWTRVSRPGIADGEVAGLALLLTVLFVWMKAAQAWFAARLAARALDAAAPEFTPARLACVVRRQIRYQVPALLWLPLSLLLVVPFAWAHAYAQNLCVLSGDTASPDDVLRRRAREQALLWPVQNHLAIWLVSPRLLLTTVAVVFGAAHWFIVSGLLPTAPFAFLTVLLIVVLVVWPCSPFGFALAANVAAVVLAVPFLVESLSGLRTAAVVSPLAAVGNTTFLAVVMGLTYLALDPVMKAAYVLRCIRGESLRTGADLLAALRRASPVVPILLFSAFAACGALADPDGDPASPAPPSEQVSAESLDRAIEQVLREPRYQWPIPGRIVEPDLPDEPSWLGDFLAAAGEWLHTIWAKVRDAFRRMLDRLFTWRGGEDAGTPADSRPLVVFIFGVLAAALCLAALLYYRSRRRRAAPDVSAVPVTPAPDVADESVLASAMPPDEWLARADDLAARGEWRLAVRALFLSALSALHAAALVRVGRHKTNRDYLNELVRRQHALPGLVEAFADSMRVFEGSWYGDHVADEAQFGRCRGNVEAIRRHGIAA
jgi:hypothetical protein